MPLIADRNTQSRAPGPWEHPVAANAVIYAGALIALNAAGFAVPGSLSTTLRALGKAESSVNNAGGANGAKLVGAERGVHLFRNFAGDAVTQADVLTNCFIVDDEFVARTNGANTRSIAGRVLGVEAAGVWVEFI